MIKGIVFDIGGVLAYDVQEYLFYESGTGVIAKYGLDERDVSRVVGFLWEKYSRFSKDHEETWQEVEKEYWTEFKDQTNLDVPIEDLVKLSKQYTRPVPNMLNFLHHLKNEGFDLLICSNNCEFWFQRQKQIAFPDVFEKRKMILSNHYGEDKDHPNMTMFSAVEKNMDYKKEEYIFVDDRKKNMDAALKFGITPILFPQEAPYGASYLQSIIDKINS